MRTRLLVLFFFLFLAEVPGAQETKPRRAEAVLDEAALARSWRSLSAREPLPTGNGHVMSFLTGSEVGEMLNATEEDAQVLASLWDLGHDPEDLYYVRLAYDQAAAAAPPGSIQPEAILGLQETARRLSRGAAPGATRLAEVELWIGCSARADGATNACVALLVGVSPTGEKSLILGLVEEVAGDVAASDPLLLHGSWLYEAYSEDAPNSLEIPEGFEARDPAASPFKKGKLKKAVKNYTACFRACFRNLAPVLTVFQIACLAFSAAACTTAGPGWPACFLPAATFCGVGTVALDLVICGLVCL